jgi:hypothetical protein
MQIHFFPTFGLASARAWETPSPGSRGAVCAPAGNFPATGGRVTASGGRVAASSLRKENMMEKIVKIGTASAVLGGSLLAAAGFGLAQAQPPAQSVVGDGSVNVTVTAGGQQIGVLQNVSLANAQALATAACPSVGVTADALKALDANGTAVPGTCGADGGVTFTFGQNGPGNSGNAPGQNLGSTTPSTTATTTTTKAS